MQVQQASEAESALSRDAISVVVETLSEMGFELSEHEAFRLTRAFDQFAPEWWRTAVLTKQEVHAGLIRSVEALLAQSGKKRDSV